MTILSVGSMPVLVRAGVLDGARPLFVPPRGRDGPLALACVPGPVWLCCAVAVRFLLPRLPEQLNYQCLEIPGVS
jgi:hypothetical protein